MPGQIKKLSENVINKIAAGEVIKDPAAIVKELTENSIDAKSTSISIHIRKGGLDLIEISDNGTGIDYDDFPLLCERFATSKISSSDDLRNISSFGFRGEALASVSYVANLTVVSKTRSSDVAYTTRFSEGKILAVGDEEPLPKPTQSHDGTIMIVEDLFMNIPSRKAGLSPSEEYSKILKLVMRLAIHYHMISFTLKKDGKVELSTTNIPRKDRPDFDIRQDLISRFYGNNIGNNLLRHDISLSNWKCEFSIVFTKPDKKIKGKNLILFINDRLVECDSIKKAFGAAYADSVFGIHDLNAEYFSYTIMRIKNELIDVNVNPTKKEVHFLHERSIAEKIKSELQEHLKENMNIKTFKTPLLRQLTFDSDSPLEQSKSGPLISDFQKSYDKNLVRTDPKAQRLDKFFKQSEQKFGMTIRDFIPERIKEDQDKMEIESEGNQTTMVDEKGALIQDIIADYTMTSDKETIKFLQNIVFVGSISTNYVCCQYEQQLLLINTIPLCEEAFYLICLKQFGNFSSKELPEPPLVESLLWEAFEQEGTDNDTPIEKNVQKCLEKLDQIQSILIDFLSLSIENGFLLRIPQILNGICVPRESLGEFLIRLCSEIDFNNKKEMIKGLCRELSFHMAWSLENDDHTSYNLETKAVADKLFEGHFFPLLKSELSYSKVRKSELCAELLQLQDIYKIFERC